MTKILCLPKYTEQGASSRYRLYQYLPFLEQAGFQAVVRPLFSEDYLRRVYSDQLHRRKPVGQMMSIARALFRRWFLLLHEVSDFDVVYLEYEALPYLPMVFEKRLFTSTRVVVDYDDAVYVNYAYHLNPLVRRTLGSKIPDVVKRSHQVITGNHFLAEWAAKINPNVTVIPTSIDLRRYPLGRTNRPMNDKLIIGWIGTPVTAKYLYLLREPLQMLRTRYNFALKVIGAPDFEMEGIEVIGVPWSQETEVNELCTCDIGVMPLPDDPWAQGKSALKLLQYLAARIAAVASPVGASCDVLQDGQNGLLASTEEEWIEKLAVLIDNSALREQVAEAGRRTVETQYSLQVNAPRWVDVLQRVVSSER